VETECLVGGVDLHFGIGENADGGRVISKLLQVRFAVNHVFQVFVGFQEALLALRNHHSGFGQHFLLLAKVILVVLSRLCEILRVVKY